MHRILAGLVMGMLLWLTGCGSTLAEEDLVKEGQAFEMDKVVDDLQASNFPYEAEYDRKKEFSTLEEVRQEVKDLLGERYWPDVPISKEELTSDIGITEDMYVDYLAERQVLDSHIDRMIIIHAREDSIGAVEQALERYREGVIAENEGHPQNLGKAEASRMEVIDDYICFLQLGADTTVVAEQGQEAITNYCLEENEQALYVIEQALLQ